MKRKVGVDHNTCTKATHMHNMQGLWRLAFLWGLKPVSPLFFSFFLLLLFFHFSFFFFSPVHLHTLST